MTDADRRIVEHMHLIPRLARRVKRVLVTADVSELESAGYLALVKAARNFRGERGCKFSTYLYSCARGEMYRSFTRPDGHKDHYAQEWLPLGEAKALAGGADPFERLDARERRERVTAALAALKPEHEQILRLFYFDEVEVAELAAEGGEAYGRVYKTLRTAKAAFREAYCGRPPYRRGPYRPRAGKEAGH